MDKELEKIIKSSVEENIAELKHIRDYLYENPEIGGTEEKASALLMEIMEKHGFSVENEFHKIDYCFRSEFDSGKPGASIGITAEYDALEEIGHGCGHNLIAATSVGAALALKEVVKKTGGRVILYGTPAEENLVKKAQLSQEGAFDEVDVAMMAHPNPTNLSSGKTMSVDAWQVDFYGKAAHAGISPEEGINALDAAVHFYSLIGFEKQYLKDTNIYGIFASAGERASIIPDFASVRYLVRAFSSKDVRKVRNMFERCAEAAAKATGATFSIWNNEPANMSMATNYTLSDAFNRNFEYLGGGKMPSENTGGATDMGDVSHRVAAIHPWIGMNCPQFNLHSQEFADATMSFKGDKIIEMGAEALALTGADVLTDPELLKKIKEEFEESKKDW